MMYRVGQTILTAVLFTGLATAAPGTGGRVPANGDPDRQERVKDGKYTITIKGYYSGTGTATVTPTSVHLKADDLRGLDGSAGQLDIMMSVTGPYVAGTGNMPSGATTIVGRLDAPKASRLVCTYRAANIPGEPAGYRSGRIAGTLPTDVGDEGWDDEQVRFDQ